ncbi:hypothetical protein OSB04_016997 [Centaurea solstitialis]|uniref:Uncharacterized protein n=1 Tax=Centaurea solstitialis TaxID=347529 RepID=A0AA38W924_9ASTR|nr:hypothetical protein OSB04_016997 [Centaurea solstitialis]
MLNFQPSDFDVDSLPLIVPNAKYDENKMREAIANWVLGTEQPFTVMEEVLYVKMMKTAQPQVKKFSRATSRTDCFKIYEHEKKKLKALTKAASKISLTTNCWRSSHQRIEYMVITGHFIDKNWRFDDFGNCLKEWEIENKIFTISVDNAAYNDRVVRTLKDNFSREKRLSCEGRLFHIRYCAYILNILMKDTK